MLSGTMVNPAAPAAAVFKNFLREYVFIVLKFWKLFVIIILNQHSV